MPQTPHPQPSLAQRFAPIVEGLCAKIAVHAAANHALAPLLVLVWTRLRRMLARLDRLVTRWQSGRLRPARSGGKHPSSPRPRIPTGPAWLIRLVQPTAQLAPQVEALLRDPEIIALLQAAPQAGRIFRPLCRMLGIEPPEPLRLPARPRPPRPRVEAPPPPPPRPELGWLRPPGGHSFIPVPARMRMRIPRRRYSAA